MKEKIIKKLSKNLTIKHLQVINNSHLHLGHLGDDGTGETHFEVIIFADEFKDGLLIESHRKINDLLKQEFKDSNLHSLSIRILKNY